MTQRLESRLHADRLRGSTTVTLAERRMSKDLIPEGARPIASGDDRQTQRKQEPSDGTHYSTYVLINDNVALASLDTLSPSG